MNSKIVDFYLNGGEDFAGRTFEQLLDWSDEQLERSHDQVQWFFPLNEASAHSRHAPVLTEEDIVALATPLGQDQFRRAYLRWMKFFGMRVVLINDDLLGGIEPDWGDEFDNFTPRAQVWLSPMNHNLKRITRIIRCAMLFDMKDVSEKTRDGFSDIHNLQSRLTGGKLATESITEKVLAFWSDAVNLPLDKPLNTPPPIQRKF